MIPRLPVADFFSLPAAALVGPVAYAAAPARHTVTRAVFVTLACGQQLSLCDAIEAADWAMANGRTVRVGSLLLRVAQDERGTA